MPQRQAGDIGATYQDAPTKSINVGERVLSTGGSVLMPACR
ncbi:alpha/beta hydrolase [Mycobacterium tuberculosis]|nr:alpha/beta hydrolase [Mycobacterium tuberculosis]